MTNSDWELHFGLSRKVSCESQVTKSHQNIEYELTTENSGQKYLTGFIITLTNKTEADAKLIGQKQAKNFANYLSISSGLPVEEHLDGTRIKNPSGGHTVTKTFTIGYSIENNADLQIPDAKLLDIVNEKDLSLSQQMAYVASAMKSITARSPEAAIRDLVLACGENPQGNLEKFKSLRNALSHDPVYPNDIQKIKQNFGNNYFEFIGDRFDHNSHNNKKHLMDQAQLFLTEVRNELLRKI